MSLLQETIVVFWLLPVATQILIPLALFAGVLIRKVLRGMSAKKSVAQRCTGSNLKTAESAA